MSNLQRKKKTSSWRVDASLFSPDSLEFSPASNLNRKRGSGVNSYVFTVSLKGKKIDKRKNPIYKKRLIMRQWLTSFSYVQKQSALTITYRKGACLTSWGSKGIFFFYHSINRTSGVFCIWAQNLFIPLYATDVIL